MRFNLIIANPPYRIGNEITAAILKEVDFDHYINLMPLGYYQGRDLASYVKTMELVDPKHFSDAVISNNLCVCELTKKQTSRTFDDLALISYSETYRDYYKLNSLCTPKHRTKYQPNVKDGLGLDNDTVFIAGKRVCKDGVHKMTNTYDYHFNIAKDISYQDLPNPPGRSWYDVWAMYFNSATEKDHFNIFWYKNPLANELIKGLNKNGGTPDAAIPNIDWSKNHDYAHLTKEDLMEILREENHL